MGLLNPGCTLVNLPSFGKCWCPGFTPWVSELADLGGAGSGNPCVSPTLRILCLVSWPFSYLAGFFLPLSKLHLKIAEYFSGLKGQSVLTVIWNHVCSLAGKTLQVPPEGWPRHRGGCEPRTVPLFPVRIWSPKTLVAFLLASLLCYFYSEWPWWITDSGPQFPHL